MHGHTSIGLLVRVCSMHVLHTRSCLARGETGQMSPRAHRPRGKMCRVLLDLCRCKAENDSANSIDDRQLCAI